MVVCRLWHPCQPRYPRFVHFSWSFPVNWYIQSILLYPAIKSVTFVSASLLHSHAQLQTCLYSKPSYLPVASKPPCRALVPFHYRFLLFTTTAICHFSSVLLVDPCCRRNTTHLVHVMTCILPPSFFPKSFNYFLALRRTMYNAFMFSALLFILHDPTVYRFSLPTRCGSPLITFIQPLHLDPVITSLSRLYLNRLFFRTLSYRLPCGAQLPPCLAYSSLVLSYLFFFFFCFLFCYLSTIHELVTKIKEQCDDFFWPCPSLGSDPG